MYTHTSNTVWTNQVMFRNMCVHICIQKQLVMQEVKNLKERGAFGRV